MGQLCGGLQEVGCVGSCDVFELQGGVVVGANPKQESWVGMQRARLFEKMQMAAATRQSRELIA